MSWPILNENSVRADLCLLENLMASSSLSFCHPNDWICFMCSDGFNYVNIDSHSLPSNAQNSHLPFSSLPDYSIVTRGKVRVATRSEKSERDFVIWKSDSYSWFLGCVLLGRVWRWEPILNNCLLFERVLFILTGRGWGRSLLWGLFALFQRMGLSTFF